MPTVGTINIDLRMGTAAVVTGANKAVAVVDNMASRITKSINSIVGSVVPTISIESMLTGFKSLVLQQNEVIDNIGKLSDRLNIGTESYIGLAHAADLAGVSAEEFGGLMEKLQKNLGNMAEDGGATKSIVEKLGLKLKDIRTQGIDVTFLAIADAVAKIPDPIERAHIMTELFSKSGQKLTNTLIAGKSSIRDAMEEAEKLGMVYSRMDASKVEEANDSWTRLKGAIGGFGNKVAIETAGYRKFMSDLATHMMTHRDLGDKMPTPVSFMLARMDRELKAAQNRNDADASKLSDAIFGTVGAWTQQGIKLGDAVRKGLELSRDKWKAIGESLTESVATPTEKWAKKLETLTAALKSGNISAETFSRSVLAAGQSINDSLANVSGPDKFSVRVFGNIQQWAQTGKMIGAALANGVVDAAKQAKEKWDRIGAEIAEAVKTPIERFKDQQANIDAAFKTGRITPEQRNRATAENARSLQGPASVVQTASAIQGGTVAANNRFAQAYNEGLNGRAAGKGKGFADIFREAQKQSAIQQRMDDNLAEQVAIWRGINVGVIP